MKSIIVTLAALFALISIIQGATLETLDAEGPACSVSKWKLFKEKFAKEYANRTPQEDATRREIFCTNYQRILQHNANPNSTFTMALNQFSDLTHDEVKQRIGLRSIGNDALEKVSLINELSLKKLLWSNTTPNLTASLPEEVDWSRDASRVSPARNQGDCGSCWAFASIGMLEGQEKPGAGKQLVELSEQNLVDCDRKNNGCNGGWYPAAFDEMRRNGGVMRRSEYPYVSGVSQHPGRCRMDRAKAYETTVNLGELRMLRPGDESLLKEVLAKYGPVAAAVEATDEFIDYQDGVFYSKECTGSRPNHGILIVGYGKDKQTGRDYWKIKNSWSQEWGRFGFGKMSRNRGNNCLIASSVFVVLPKNTADTH